jgi:hypothetical protein
VQIRFADAAQSADKLHMVSKPSAAEVMPALALAGLFLAGHAASLAAMRCMMTAPGSSLPSP